MRSFLTLLAAKTTRADRLARAQAELEEALALVREARGGLASGRETGPRSAMELAEARLHRARKVLADLLDAPEDKD